jgi:hypothetical protein
LTVNPFELHPDAVPEKTYFAQPVSLYGTELKRFLLEKIRERFPGSAIEDPDTQEHREGYGRSGMEYFIEEILPGCGRIVFLAFRDSKIGAGVHGETLKMLISQRKVFEIFPDGRIIQISRLDHARKLSIPETRSRIRNEDGSVKPY